jgi:cell division septum initiation protein DivIVA
MKESAKRDAQLVLREATLNAEKLMEEARAEGAKLNVEIQGLKRLRRQLIEELRATVERYDRTLTADLGGAGGDARPS